MCLLLATPSQYGTPVAIDETLNRFSGAHTTGDLVGIGIHTANALRGFEVGRLVGDRGAFVVFGGIHASLYPAEAREHGAACSGARRRRRHLGEGVGRLRQRRTAAVVRWRAGDECQPVPTRALGFASAGSLYVGLRPDRTRLPEALLVLFCMAHRWSSSLASARATRSLRRSSSCEEYRFIALADDNFYPVTLADIDLAERQHNSDRIAELRLQRALQRESGQIGHLRERPEVARPRRIRSWRNLPTRGVSGSLGVRNRAPFQAINRSDPQRVGRFENRTSVWDSALRRPAQANRTPRCGCGADDRHQR